MKCLDNIAINKNTFNQLDNVKVLGWVTFALFFVGFIFRLSPIFDIENRVFWQYMTEDGYLMQTIARNMAIGLGMSTAEGTMPTNGVQPLATVIFAGLHYLAGGDKSMGIVYVTIFSAITALLAALGLKKLTLTLFKEWQITPTVASLVAALWFASPLVIGHSTNGLETGLYYLFIIISLHYYFSLSLNDQLMSSTQRIILGVLLGITFLSRNDAVFFIAALLVAHVFISNAGVLSKIKHRFVDASVAGVASIIVGLPWLIYNKVNFGSIVPISGTAESHNAVFGENFMMIPANLLEASFVYLPIPRALETTLPVFIVSSLIIAFISFAFWKLFASKSLNAKRFFITSYIFTACIGGYYGLTFGASWFVTRYTSALTPMLWLVSFAVMYLLLFNRLSSQAFKKIMLAISVILLAIGLGKQIFVFKNGDNHMHKQVVDWALENVDRDTWVAAPQTGTLGFFHDRTINLDGKTNSDALKALLEDGHNLSYILDTPAIKYVIDWAGMCHWVETTHEPRFGQTFDVLIRDKEANLCVMKRMK